MDNSVITLNEPSRHLWKKGLELAKNQLKKEKEESHGSMMNNRSRKLHLKSSLFNVLSEPTKEFLIDNNEENISSLEEVFFVYLTYYQFKSIGSIQHCAFLTICILNNNHLTHFYGLINCPCLKRLDLHANQISELPDQGFWSELKNLQLLNLHNNFIADVKSFRSLNKCQVLTALTMFNNCIGEQHQYRPIVVNFLWFLKALDNYVIADEEIVGGFASSRYFTALTPIFFVDLCPEKTKSVKLPTHDKEKKFLREVMSEIHQKLCHFSPITIIQRWVRGHLCRKKLNKSYVDIRDKMKGLDLVGVSSIFQSAITLDLPRKEMSLQEFALEIPRDLMLDLRKLQLDLYHAYRNNSNPTVMFHVLQNSTLLSKPSMWRCLRADSRYSATEKFARLLSETFTNAETSILRKKLKEDLMKKYFSSFNKRLEQLDKVIRNQYVQSQPHPMTDNHFWRVHDKNIEVDGKASMIAEMDAFTLHVRACARAGKDLRDALEEWRIKVKNKPLPQVVKKKPLIKLHDNFRLDVLMSISALYKAWEAVEKKERQLVRVAEVERVKLKGRLAAASFREKKRTLALNLRASDKSILSQVSRFQTADRALHKKEFSRNRLNSLSRRAFTTENRSLAYDLGRSVGCLSHALTSHDKLHARVKTFNSKKENTEKIKADRLRGQIKQHVHASRKHLMNLHHRKQDSNLARTIITAEATEDSRRRREIANRIRAEKASGREIISYHLPVVSNESSQHRRRLVQSIKPNASNKMSQSIQTSYPSTLSLLSKPSEHPEEPTVTQSF